MAETVPSTGAYHLPIGLSFGTIFAPCLSKSEAIGYKQQSSEALAQSGSVDYHGKNRLLPFAYCLCYSARYNMTDETELLDADVAVSLPIEDDGAVAPRIYEIGYHIIPTVKEGDVERIVSEIRGVIGKAGGSFIAEGAPSLIRLAYPMSALAAEGEKRAEYDRGYFGWIKFESAVEAVNTLIETLKSDANILRFGVFRTVREDTRAKMKAPTLREVKRTDTIRSSPRRAATEEKAAPVSETALEKAIQDITTE